MSTGTAILVTLGGGTSGGVAFLGGRLSDSWGRRPQPPGTGGDPCRRTGYLPLRRDLDARRLDRRPSFGRSPTSARKYPRAELFPRVARHSGSLPPLDRHFGSAMGLGLGRFSSEGLGLTGTSTFGDRRRRRSICPVPSERKGRHSRLRSFALRRHSHRRTRTTTPEPAPRSSRHSPPDAGQAPAEALGEVRRGARGEPWRGRDDSPLKPCDHDDPVQYPDMPRRGEEASNPRRAFYQPFDFRSRAKALRAAGLPTAILPPRQPDDESPPEQPTLMVAMVASRAGEVLGYGAWRRWRCRP